MAQHAQKTTYPEVIASLCQQAYIYSAFKNASKVIPVWVMPKVVRSLDLAVNIVGTLFLVSAATSALDMPCPKKTHNLRS
jgi:hypothetical protein